MKIILYICIWLMWLNYPQTAVSSELLPYTFLSEHNIILNKMAHEQWKQIKGYEERYLISDHGRVLSLPYTRINLHTKSKCYYKLKLLKPGKSNRGYYEVGLAKNGCRKHGNIARLVGLHFIPNPDNKPEINHRDGVKANNYVDNLEWCTRSENIIHAFRLGLKKPTKLMLGKFGSDHHRSKAVLQISNGEVVAEFESMIEASRETGIDYSGISQACNGQFRSSGGYQWKHKTVKI